MPPLLKAALGSIVRWVLTLGVGFFVERGIWTQEEATTYVAALALAILTLGWSLWQKYKTHLTILRALDLPAGSTVERLNAQKY